ncbi:hypothetical protein PJ267_12750 [Arthrobacter sp. OVS8]|nr:hypothetical protein PJ267_12750 [Arthrobacter sp. OVS8]
MAGRSRVRIDSGFVAGSSVMPFYDSLLAKIIVWDETREEAIGRSIRALDEITIEGVSTTIPLLSAVLHRPELKSVEHHTKFIETCPEILGDLS